MDKEIVVMFNCIRSSACMFLVALSFGVPGCAVERDDTSASEVPSAPRIAGLTLEHSTDTEIQGEFRNADTAVRFRAERGTRGLIFQAWSASGETVLEVLETADRVESRFLDGALTVTTPKALSHGSTTLSEEELTSLDQSIVTTGDPAAAERLADIPELELLQDLGDALAQVDASWNQRWTSNPAGSRDGVSAVRQAARRCNLARKIACGAVIAACGVSCAGVGGLCLPACLVSIGRAACQACL
jgi:hypothetical protein